MKMNGNHTGRLKQRVLIINSTIIVAREKFNLLTNRTLSLCIPLCAGCYVLIIGLENCTPVVYLFASFY